MSRTDRVAIAMAAGILVGLCMWALTAMLGPTYTGLLFGAITATIAARHDG